MKTEDIQEGDVLLQDGTVVYTVETVTINRPHVVATVRFADGGNGQRLFELGKDVPLVRPL